MKLQLQIQLKGLTPRLRQTLHQLIQQQKQIPQQKLMELQVAIPHLVVMELLKVIQQHQEPILVRVQMKQLKMEHCDE